jgi:hypothetical protein
MKTRIRIRRSNTLTLNLREDPSEGFSELWSKVKISKNKTVESNNKTNAERQQYRK